jgi:hypothetical protein
LNDLRQSASDCFNDFSKCDLLVNLPSPKVDLPARKTIPVKKTMLHISPFDGTTFGSEIFNQEVPTLPAFDRLRGWSWDGKTASLLSFKADGTTWVHVFPFDGKAFGSEISTAKISSAEDRLRGWSWDGKTASLLSFKADGTTWVHVSPFDGTTFGSEISNARISSAEDRLHGWSWDGKTASYLAD